MGHYSPPHCLQPVSRSLNDLHPAFRPLAVEFLARLAEFGPMVKIVDTLRTQAEHETNLANGTSWTTRSLHLDGLAMDVAPYATYVLHGSQKLEWDADDPAWARIGKVAEALGLDWGGHWTTPDWGHVEHPRGRRLSKLLRNL